MTTVIFHWQNHPSLNTPHAIKKLLNRWSFTCKAFGVYNLIAITDEDLRLGDTEINFSVAKSLEEALDGKKSVVFIEEGGKVLEKFKHPKNATYVLGSDFRGLSQKGAISISTNNALHAEVACGIVLNHRGSQWHI